MTSEMAQEQIDQIAALSSAKKRLLIEKLRKAGLAVPSRGGRLVAFYQAANPLDAEALRATCTENLPAHMVPQKFVHQEQIALTTTGKLNRNAMRARLWTAPDATEQSDVTAARNEVEEQLTEIWSDVLGIDELSVFDNFFEVGGDSLQVIRILSRAAKAGLTIKPDAIFAHPTIAELAQHAGHKAQTSIVHDSGFGSLPLLPIQSWFFNVVLTHPQHWNQSCLFALSAPLESQRLSDAVGQLFNHHDALRTTFVNEQGRWSSAVVESVEPSIRVCSLSSESEDENARMRQVADEENAAMDLAKGPLFRVVHFTQEAGAGYLALISHHLIVDAVSWQVLTADLQLLLANQSSQAVLGAKSTSIKLWAERLEELAGSQELGVAAAFWQAHAEQVQIELPGAAAEIAANTEGECRWLSRSLDKTHTEVLRTVLPGDLRASVQELVLSALVRVLSRWTGRNRITLDLEGHGRETLFDHVDISQTVGWCTSVFPVTFSDQQNNEWASSTDALRLIKEQLRAVPHNGLSHGLLSHLSPQTELRDALNASPRSQLLFNYLGREDDTPVPNAPLTLVDGRFGTTRHPDTQRAYLLELNAVIRSDELVVDWAYCPETHSEGVIAGLADELIVALQELITGQTEAVSTVTPTDFPMAGLDQAALDSLSSQLDGMDDDIDVE